MGKVELRFVYHLVDPRTEKVYYVGQTNDPQKRLLQHLYSPEHPTTKELIRLEQRPVMKVVVESECSLQDILALEFEEIKKFPKEQLENKPTMYDWKKREESGL